ncbi:MAG: hypothetical protein V3U20_03985, partial [Thermoplasmata archaeon]
FILFGIISIISFFILISTVEGPYIVSYYEEERDDSSGSSTMFMLPIWIFLMYLGSGALFIGFLLKFLSIVKNPYQQLDVLVYVGCSLSAFNMFLMIYHIIESSTAIYIVLFHLLGPFVLLLTVPVSIAYLVVYWLKNQPRFHIAPKRPNFHNGHPKH